MAFDRLKVAALAVALTAGGASFGYAQTSTSGGSGGSAADNGASASSLGAGGSSTDANGQSSGTIGSGGSAAAGGSSASTLGLGGRTTGPEGNAASAGVGGSAAGDKTMTNSKMNGNENNLHGHAKAQGMTDEGKSKSMTKLRNGQNGLTAQTRTMSHIKGEKPVKSTTSTSVPMQ